MILSYKMCFGEATCLDNGSGMKKSLSWAVAASVAANIGYALWSFAGASSGYEQAKPELMVAALSPLAAEVASGSESGQSPSRTEQESWACMKFGPLADKEAEEALLVLGAGAKSKPFEAEEGKEVRFGPWAKSDLPALEEILGPWRPAKVRPCDAKESEEWEKAKEKAK